jgi:chromosome segregation ATPase
VELESQLSAAREAAAKNGSSAPASSDKGGRSSDDTAKEVQDAVEKVARELHSLYKSKHETKVAALKKSYEARWEKRVREAETKFRDAIVDNERLKAELDLATSGAHVGEATMIRETEELEAQKRVLEAKVKGLEQELIAVKRDDEALRSELKHERAEKSELVAVVDEWLAMQEEPIEEAHHAEAQRTPSLEPPSQQMDTGSGEPRDQQAGEGLRNVSNETTGSNETTRDDTIASAHPPSSTNVRSRVPQGTTPKVPRFGMPNGHSRANSAGSNVASGIARPPPTAGRSGIMNSIERMGRGGS